MKKTSEVMIEKTGNDFRGPVERVMTSLLPGMMLSRTKIIPLQREEKCVLCGVCTQSCPHH